MSRDLQCLLYILIILFRVTHYGNWDNKKNVDNGLNYDNIKNMSEGDYLKDNWLKKERGFFCIST
jgi:hypothetical protein